MTNYRELHFCVKLPGTFAVLITFIFVSSYQARLLWTGAPTETSGPSEYLSWYIPIPSPGMVWDRISSVVYSHTIPGDGVGAHQQKYSDGQLVQVVTPVRSEPDVSTVIVS